MQSESDARYKPILIYIGSHLAPEKYFYLFNTQIVW